MHITVAICTWNRSALLDQTLAGLRAVRVPPGANWEVLVVNNNCTDDTDAVLDRHAVALPLRRAFEPAAGVANARNRALDHARGEWIVWTDDDVLVDPDWLGGFSRTAARFPDAAAVAGRVVPWFPAEPDPDLLAAFPALRMGFCGMDYGPAERELGPDVDQVYTVNLAVHRGRTAGLRFDPAYGRWRDKQTGGEDIEFIRAVRAAGGRVVWSPDMLVRHYVAPWRMTVDFFRRYAADAGEQHVRLQGVPPGPRLFGATRWLLRRYAQTLGVCVWNRLVRGRVAYLMAQRAHWFVRGMIRGCRAAAAPAPGSEIRVATAGQ
jgi:glycosyltransferase involved in cell wall biosynthesis